MIKLDKISFSYGKTKILNNISLTAETGKCIVIAGPNGSGKSTLLSIIAGARKASDGKVEISDKIGYVPQGIALFEDLSVKENVKFFAAVNKIKVSDLNKLPFNLTPIANKKVSKLSTGMKKRVSIVCALVSDPYVIILDEPCAALDIIYRDELLELINELKNNGKTIIYVGHDFNEISRIYDTLLLIKNGNAVFYKTKDELPSSSDELEEYVRKALIS
ncbi:MAG: ABC transporter ATP-binding protein [Oscillospiraceae bacterium]|nr:ABC transporter ATP-binding protein [Oscillospiraceae bacterium]